MEKVSVFVGILGLLVAIATFATPEIRCLAKLPSERCPLETTNNNSSVNPSENIESIEPLPPDLTDRLGSSDGSGSIDETTINTVTLSEKYSDLEQALSKKQWVTADTETTSILSESRIGKGFDILADIPCESLVEIDRLWMQYSDNQFGFTPQSENMKQVVEDNSEEWLGLSMYSFQKYGNTVAWRKNSAWLNSSEISYSSSAPKGHLPWLWGTYMNVNKISSDYYKNKSNHTPNDWAENQTATTLGRFYEKVLICNGRI